MPDSAKSTVELAADYYETTGGDHTFRVGDDLSPRLGISPLQLSAPGGGLATAPRGRGGIPDEVRNLTNDEQVILHCLMMLCEVAEGPTYTYDFDLLLRWREAIYRQRGYMENGTSW